MAVYGITRVSTADQVDGTSLDSQARKINAMAGIAGHTLTEIFVDAGVSGSIPLVERPQGGIMAAQLQSGDTVIATKIDRLFRSAADALVTVKEWQDRGIDLIIVAFGSDPVTANGTSKLLMGILAMVADFERDMIRERTNDGREAKKAAGGHIGGSTPFGFLKIGEGKGAMLQTVMAEQIAIDHMVALKAMGQSLRKISAAVEEKHGFKVSHVAVGKAIKRRAELTAS